MNLEKSLSKLYVKLSTDENLLRLLHYKPMNQNDNPLDLKKPDILSLPDIQKWQIIDNVLLPSDKKFDLDLKVEICRICFYPNYRRPQDKYSSSARKMINNRFAMDQYYNFDVYVHVNIDIVDMRLAKILDRLNQILWGEGVTDIGEFTWVDGGVINNTPNGFLGYRAIFHTSSLQEPFRVD